MQDGDGDHLTDKDTGMLEGVPAGAGQEEGKGLPDSGRQHSETAGHPEGGKTGPG